MRWSSDDGPTSAHLEFDAYQMAGESIALKKDVSWQRLARLRLTRGKLEQIRISCGKDYGDDPETYDGVPHLTWNCAAASCSLDEGVYLMAGRPRNRIDAWTRRGGHADSRFRDELRAGSGLPKAPATKLARDLAADLSDLIHAACPLGRCIADMELADAALQRFASATSVDYERTDVDSSKPEPFGHGYTWNVSAGGTKLAVRCDDSFNGEHHQIICSMELLEGGPGVLVRFDAFRSTIELENPSREIRVSGRRTVSVNGSLLRAHK